MTQKTRSLKIGMLNEEPLRLLRRHQTTGKANLRSVCDIIQHVAMRRRCGECCILTDAGSRGAIMHEESDYSETVLIALSFKGIQRRKGLNGF